MSQPDPGAPSSVTTAVKQVLRPLIGLLLDNGLTYTWFIKIAKVIFVDVAKDEFTIEGKPQTDSRISLLTSVHRKDIRNFRSDSKVIFDPPSSIFIGAQLVSIWTTEDKFIDENGNPVPLARTPGRKEDSNALSFQELVVLVNKDIRPRVILDEWIQLGVVSIDDRDRVCLDTNAFVPAKGFDEKMFYLGKNVHDHVAAARKNVASETPPFLERAVYYDQLTEQSVRELEALSKEKSIELLTILNKRARQLQSSDKSTRGRKMRMNFGLYYFSDDD